MDDFRRVPRAGAFGVHPEQGVVIPPPGAVSTAGPISGDCGGRCDGGSVVVEVF